MDLASFKKNDVLLELLKAASVPIHVGLSYELDDKETVDKLHDRLVEKNLSVWIETENLSKQGIGKCKVVVVFVSEKYESSDNCIRQLKYVDEKMIPMIVIRTDGDFEPNEGGAMSIILSGTSKPHLLTGADDEAFDKVVSVIVDKVEKEKKEKDEE